MPFVLDTSVTVRWRLAERADALTTGSLRRLDSDYAVAPEIWWFEVRNALLVQERHGNLDPAKTAAFLTDLGALPIRIDRDTSEPAVFALAREHRLSIYDAAYLEVAARLGQPLATLDNRLAAAARRAGIALLGSGAP